MTTERRLAALERLAPLPGRAGGDDAHRADLVLALYYGDPLPDGMTATDHERRAAEILAVMAAAPAATDDGADEDGDA